MKILMTGATGFIGSHLGRQLTDLGHSVVIVTRNSAKAAPQLGFKADFVDCDLNYTALPPESFTGVDAIINLAGESVDGRWTREKKNKILNSRVQSSKNLLKNCPPSVKTIVTASAQGVYGNRGNEELTEISSEGEGFLADVCKAWEAEFKNRPQRLVILRLGMVLSKKGGALKKLISLFRKNLGATLGPGTQWMSYIGLNDLAKVMIESVTNENYKGVINAVNNKPMTNAEFTKELCKYLKVRQLPRVPSVVLKIVLGQMSELVLFSLKAKPQKLNELGFKFQETDLATILNSN